jgi:hypothetical protein
VDDIRYIENTIGLGALPGVLEDAAKARLEYPDASLKELGAVMTPAIGKSGVNHRLQRISEIASELRNKEETGK